MSVFKKIIKKRINECDLVEIYSTDADVKYEGMQLVKQSQTIDGYKSLFSPKELKPFNSFQANIGDFLFFSPDAVWKDSDFQCLEYDNDSWFKISGNVLRKKEVSPGYDSLRLDFSVFWKFLFSQYGNFAESIRTRSYKLKNSLNLVKNAGAGLKNFRPLKCEFKDEQITWAKRDDYFVADISFNYSLDYECFMEILKKETLHIEVSLNDSSSEGNKNTLNITKDLKLPSENSIAPWQSEKQYVVGDQVIYEGSLLRCMQDNKSGNFEPGANWKCVKKDYDGFTSFLHCNSFFDSKYSQGCREVLKKSLPFYIDKVLGRRLELEICNFPEEFAAPAINDRFKSEGRDFRIVEVVFETAWGKQNLKIIGIEILNFKITQEITFIEQVQPEGEAQAAQDPKGTQDAEMQRPQDDEGAVRAEVGTPPAQNAAAGDGKIFGIKFIKDENFEGLMVEMLDIIEDQKRKNLVLQRRIN
jgi:hypothetical protein